MVPVTVTVASDELVAIILATLALSVLTIFPLTSTKATFKFNLSVAYPLGI